VADPGFDLTDRLLGTTSERFQLLECGGCGLRYLDPESVEARLDHFYPSQYWWESAPGLGSRLEGIYRAFVMNRDQVRFLRRRFPGGAGMSVLDIGCGSGLFVDLATKAGFDAWGLETSAEAVAAARRMGNNRVIREEIDDLAARDQRFDVVTLFHCLEHIPRPFPFLRKVQKLMKKPGHLLVQVPNSESWQARLLGRRWYGLDCPRHTCNFGLYSLLYVLGRAGFRIQAVRHFSLRDNAAALVSSLLPGLDPFARRARMQPPNSARSENLMPAEPGRSTALPGLMLSSAYFFLVLLTQPLALLEAAAGRGGTVAVHATWDV